MQDIIDSFSASIRDASARKAPLRIRGGGTKDFYGEAPRGDLLDTRAYAGIVDYEPTELVLTARTGTPLAVVEAALRQHGQMLAFEPPRFGADSTFGGCIAAGLSGPRRPYAGSARDHVLGIRMLDGKGADLRFGGQVMKNVAGYDVSRLMVGALGTLGLLLEISVKVLPKPAAELTLRQERSAAAAIELMNAWAGKPWPISATCHYDGTLYLRLSGAESAVTAARAKLGGEPLHGGEFLWDELRDHRTGLLRAAGPLWRVSLKSTSAPLDFSTSQLIEWGGALRWLSGEVDAAAVRDAAGRAGGRATLFRADDKSPGAFHPLSAPLARLHRRLKEAFDPDGILNPGRLYPDF